MKKNRATVLLIISIILMPLQLFAQKPKIVEQQGKKAPAWLNKSSSALTKMYPGKMCFVIRGRGEDLDFIEMWAKRVNGPTEVTQLISTSITSLMASSEKGNDEEGFVRAVDTLTTSVSKAKISGLLREDEWWIKKQYTDKKAKKVRFEYEYQVLYIIDQAVIDELIEQATTKATANLSADAQESVSMAMDKLIIEGNPEALSDATEPKD